jgi:hypothetical protein
MNRLTDTSPEAEWVLIEAYRKMPFERKWRLLGDLFRTARILHAAGMRLRNPAVTDEDIHAAWLAQTLDASLSRPSGGRAMNSSEDNLRTLQEVAAAFAQAGIPYALGGSLASSIHGVSRYTRDADITVEPFPGQEAQLASAFGPDYYVSLTAVQDAVRDRSSFNIINTLTGFKVDVFVRKDDPFEQSAMDRRVALEFPDAPGQPLMVQSPEDLVLFKLRWYRLGNETSEQQWKDVLGVLKVQAGKLDVGYLERWAPHLGVEDLLARARQESQPPPEP